MTAPAATDQGDQLSDARQTSASGPRLFRAARAMAARAARRPWLLAWLAFLPVAVLRAGTLSEADTFWQIRTGLITISHRAIPALDSFTWTMRGRPWTLNSWGFNVLIALAYRLGGLPAVAWECTALILAAVGLALALARQLGATPWVAAAALLLASPLLVGWLTARPQLVDYVAVLALVMLLRGIVAGQPPVRRILAAGVLSVVWVNLHAGALLGVAISVVCGLLLLLGRGTRTRGLWSVAAGAATLAGAFVNPYGLGLLAQTSQVQTDSAGLITEWQHFDARSPIQDLTLALGLAALVLAARRRDAVLSAALAVTLAGSVTAVRFMPFVVLVAVSVVAGAASHPGPAILRYAQSRRTMLRRCSIVGVLAVTIVGLVSLVHIGRPEASKYPLSITRDIPRGCRVFTTDLIGGYLILARPDAPVSLDTRNTLYGRRVLLAEERTLAGRGNLTRGLAGAGCVLVPPGSGLARRLVTNPAWRQIASDPPAGVLFVRG